MNTILYWSFGYIFSDSHYELHLAKKHYFGILK